MTASKNVLTAFRRLRLASAISYLSLKQLVAVTDPFSFSPLLPQRTLRRISPSMTFTRIAALFGHILHLVLV